MAKSKYGRTWQERLLSRLALDPSGCLLWTGPLNRYGYGYMTINYKHHTTHRLMYEMFVGLIPEGYDIDHVKALGCTNRHCASPAHLEPVTRQENLLRGDTIPAQRAAITHCPKNHEYTPENTYTLKGCRYCKICCREKCRLRKLRRQGRRKLSRGQTPSEKEIAALALVGEIVP